MIRIPAGGDYGRSADPTGPTIDCPILSIGAAHDRIVSIADLEAFDRIAPNARTVLLEDSGHLMMLERPRAVNEQIDRFLAELDSSGTGPLRS